MSEITEITEPSIDLTPAMQNFIIHWGEMGSRWGINRTVAQIHALLYISPQPLHAEDISALLSLARSTVSTGLHELQRWGIVKVVHVLGDRRDHFETMHDVWEMFRLVIDERKRRELDPTLRMLRETILDLENGGKDDPHAQEKLKEMYEFFETIAKIYEQIQNLPMASIIRLTQKSDIMGKLLKTS